MQILGELEAYSATGTEGFWWTLHPTHGTDIVESDSHIEAIHAGDHLVISDRDLPITIWSGIIHPDYKLGYRTYPLNPKFGQPSAIGMNVHWTQAGFSPDEWAKLFFHNPPYVAILTRQDPS